MQSLYGSQRKGLIPLKDPRIQKLARQIIRYSCALTKGEKVYIENFGVERAFVIALVEEAYAVGAHPLVVLRDTSIQRALIKGATDEQWAIETHFDGDKMREMDAYIAIRGGDNSYENADIPAEQMNRYMHGYSSIVHSDIRVNGTKWAVMRYPTASMAQLAETSIEAFEDYYFTVCCFDYSKMSLAMDALVARMEKTDKVHIVGNGTDLHFSIKGLPAIKCDGKLNIPDGEVFTAPVRDSVNGTVHYTAPSLYQGTVFTDVTLTFENGKIIKATGSDPQRLNEIFDADEGARYVGEFAIGVNPHINKPMKDILFDEKIAGSFHFTPGNCYDNCNNGNKSSIHWDLVCIQTPAYGGGEMYFDGELIRKDGLFIPEELQCLNPENLI